jgi:pimeloyl-ACP methyl ester carboxylesterase
MTNYVLVHGGFVGGWYWSEVAERLRMAGHRVEVIEQLPSAGTDPAPADLAADAEVVKQAVERVGEPVVLVGHSYAGMVITELADHPAVAHRVYSPHDDGTVRATDDLEQLRQKMCADVDKPRAYSILRRFQPQSAASLTAPSTAPDRDHPTTYIICEKDQAILAATQEQMAAFANSSHRLPSAHQPMTSMPDELADVLSRV